MTVLDQIRAVADLLIEQGATPAAINLELRKNSLPEIGRGGGGPHDVPECRYCGAYGGGGHGGLCPAGGTAP